MCDGVLRENAILLSIYYIYKYKTILLIYSFLFLSHHWWCSGVIPRSHSEIAPSRLVATVWILGIDTRLEAYKAKALYGKLFKNILLKGQNDSILGRAYILHAFDLCMIPDIPYGQ